ncbi:MAG: hypothetical protein AB6733_23660 [Clostridiaceae bacterium]
MEKVSNEILDVIKEIRETIEIIQEQFTETSEVSDKESKKLDYNHEEVIEKLSNLENKLDEAIKNN